MMASDTQEGGCHDREGRAQRSFLVYVAPVGDLQQRSDATGEGKDSGEDQPDPNLVPIWRGQEAQSLHPATQARHLRVQGLRAPGTEETRRLWQAQGVSRDHRQGHRAQAGTTQTIHTDHQPVPPGPLREDHSAFEHVPASTQGRRHEDQDGAFKREGALSMDSGPHARSLGRRLQGRASCTLG